MLDDLRSSLQMASGRTEATTAKAKDVVTGLLSSGLSLTTKAMPAPEMMGQVQELADDLVATSKNNRDTLTAMIRAEVDKAVGRMGFVREDELAALRRHVQRLERQIADIQGDLDQARVPAESIDVFSSVADEAEFELPGAEMPDEADVIADEAAAVADTEAVAEALAEAVDQPVDAAASAAPADVVGEAVDVPKKKKKKLIVDPSAGA